MGLLPEFKPQHRSTDSEPMAKPANVAKVPDPLDTTLASLAPLATPALSVEQAITVEHRLDDDTLAAIVLVTFPGSQFLGIHPKGAFQGPMLELPDLGRCPVCTGTKHWRVVDGKQICGLCNPSKPTTEEDEIDRLAAADSGAAVEGNEVVFYPAQPDLFEEEK
jgi:hypothetical protein